jgi:hypothetical protein
MNHDDITEAEILSEQVALADLEEAAYIEEAEAMPQHTHATTSARVDEFCPACEAEMDAYLEEQELAEAGAYIRHYGLASYVARLRFEAEEEALYAACRAMAAMDDPITRSASFDAYEMAGIVGPIRRADAEAGCVLCQRELAEDGWNR